MWLYKRLLSVAENVSTPLDLPTDGLLVVLVELSVSVQ